MEKSLNADQGVEGLLPNGVLTMSKVTSGIVLFSLLMALSLGVAFAEDEAAEETVVEINDTNVTNATNETNTTDVVEVVAEANATAA
jgi:hypothetical protein